MARYISIYQCHALADVYHRYDLTRQAIGESAALLLGAP